MFSHFLVPLDGSSLAECVIPHVLSLSRALDARVSLLQVLERPRDAGLLQPIDPLRWQLKKSEALAYLERISSNFKAAGVRVDSFVQEGPPADGIINFANNQNIDLIVLSTHGQSGLSKWNVSSIVQKIIMRSNKSTLLVRAYERSAAELNVYQYQHLFIGLDCSARAELVLPLALRLANHYQAYLTLGTVIHAPELVSHFPISVEDAQMLEQLIKRNENAVSHYLDQLHAQLSQTGINIKTRLTTSKNPIAALHAMVENENTDMMMLVAHGHSGEGRWPYGSVAASFIAYGTTSLLIMQDLSQDEVSITKAEMVNQETQGH